MRSGQERVEDVVPHPAPAVGRVRRAGGDEDPQIVGLGIEPGDRARPVGRDARQLVLGWVQPVRPEREGCDEGDDHHQPDCSHPLPRDAQVPERLDDAEPQQQRHAQHGGAPRLVGVPERGERRDLVVRVEEDPTDDGLLVRGVAPDHHGDAEHHHQAQEQAHPGSIEPQGEGRADRVGHGGHDDDEGAEEESVVRPQQGATGAEVRQPEPEASPRFGCRGHPADHFRGLGLQQAGGKVGGPEIRLGEPHRRCQGGQQAGPHQPSGDPAERGRPVDVQHVQRGRHQDRQRIDEPGRIGRAAGEDEQGERGRPPPRSIAGDAAAGSRAPARERGRSSGTTRSGSRKTAENGLNMYSRPATTAAAGRSGRRARRRKAAPSPATTSSDACQMRSVTAGENPTARRSAELAMLTGRNSLRVRPSPRPESQMEKAPARTRPGDVYCW